jgi:hypothetical protein
LQSRLAHRFFARCGRPADMAERDSMPIVLNGWQTTLPAWAGVYSMLVFGHFVWRTP